MPSSSTLTPTTPTDAEGRRGQTERKRWHFVDALRGLALLNMLGALDKPSAGLLEVDGHVSWELCREMRACGADMFVAGSSSLYQEGLDIGEAVARMSELVK